MDAGILDWRVSSYWKPRMSSTRRTIKLPKEASQQAYDLLAGMLFNKFIMKTHADYRADSVV
jgi:hypothetical protein